MSVLPASPNLEQYRKQAKELVRAAVNAMPAALARIRQHHPRWSDPADSAVQHLPFKLADAQLVIAREHGFESWLKFSRQVLIVAELQAATIGRVQPGLQRIPVAAVDLGADIGGLENAKAVVILAHASGTHRYHPHARHIAAALNRASLCTVSLDLMTEDEELAGNELEFDIPLLAARLAVVTDWIAQQRQLASMPLAYWGMANGAAVALSAAGERKVVVKAVVSSGGRPDLAGPWLWKVQAPSLLIASPADSVVIGFIRTLLLSPPASTSVYSLKLLEGASLRCDEASVRDKAASIATTWFDQHLFH